MANACLTGRFLRELLPPLLADRGAHEYILFVDEATARETELPDMPIERLRTVESQAGAASASGARSPLDLVRMGRGRPDASPAAAGPTP